MFVLSVSLSSSVTSTPLLITRNSFQWDEFNTGTKDTRTIAFIINNPAPFFYPFLFHWTCFFFLVPFHVPYSLFSTVPFHFPSPSFSTSKLLFYTQHLLTYYCYLYQSIFSYLSLVHHLILRIAFSFLTMSMTEPISQQSLTFYGSWDQLNERQIFTHTGWWW